MDVFLIVIGGFIIFFVGAVIWAVISLIFKEWKLTLFAVLFLFIPVGLIAAIHDRALSNVMVGIGFVGCTIWLLARFKGNF